MNSFYALIIMSDLSLKRIWTSAEKVADMLKEHKDIKVYRQANDQQAVLQEDGTILWKDVAIVEKL